MDLTTDQRGIIQASVAALLLSASAILAAWLWLPARLVGADAAPGVAERLAFTLRWDLVLFLWLAGCVRAVSGGRFRSAADIRGSAFGPPSPMLAVKAAVLQNSLEQTVLAFGAHLILATALQGAELVVLPVLVALFLLGRVCFALGYRQGPAARGFGMAVTAGPTIGAYLAAAVLVVCGR